MTTTESSRKLEERIDSLDNKLDTKLEQLTTMVLRIEGNMMPRADIYAEDAKRVLVETYTTAHQAMLDRITRLESGPQRLLGYIGAATGCLSATFVFLGIMASIIVAVIQAHH